MRSGKQKLKGGDLPGPARNNGVIPNSFRTLSNYFKIVSSGASNVMKSAASAASSVIADRDNETANDQVYWAGFDKLEFEGVGRKVLLLAFRFGFQVWDVEEANNVHELICRYDGPVSFMQLLPKPVSSKQCVDKFEESRPLLAVCVDVSFTGGGYAQDGPAVSCNGNFHNCQDQHRGGFSPTAVWFYSLRSQSYMDVLKFRSVIYSVRCSPLVVAVLQAAQIHCFNAATLEREYMILTNPIVVTGAFVFGSIGLGPLAMGPRWMAYSGPPVEVSNSGRVNPQHLTPVSSTSASSSGSLVAHYAKESGKQLAAGIVTLGDMGYKKLSRYYSDLLPDSNNPPHNETLGWKDRGIGNVPSPDADNVGMVIVRDVVSKSVIAQFRAHESPISSLCFDPSGILLVTASVQGHNINVFRIMPELSGSASGSDSDACYVHLYRLQRGYTTAVIQDISFSDDSNWIMISSTRGTSHLFTISPSGGKVGISLSDTCLTTKNSGSGGLTKRTVYGPSNSGLQMLNQQKLCKSGAPVSLSPVSRVRDGNNDWITTVTGAAAAATGKMPSFCGAITSSFHNCKHNGLYGDSSYLKAKYCLLIYFPSGCVIQYALRLSPGLDGATGVSRLNPSYDLAVDCDGRLLVEPIQKWNVCPKLNQRERENNIDIYGDNGNSDSSKIFPEEMGNGNIEFLKAKDTVAKVKISTDERHHLRISEAELKMHLPWVLLWEKSEITFLTMIKDDIKVGEEVTSKGEFQIEGIPACTIEARSKILIPVSNHSKIPKFQMSSDLTSVEKSIVVVNQGSEISDNKGKTVGSSSEFRAAMDRSAIMGKHENHIEKIGVDDLLTSNENTEGFVNTCTENSRFNTRLQFVNNRDSCVKQTEQKFINSLEGSNMENGFEGGNDEFD